MLYATNNYLTSGSSSEDDVRDVPPVQSSRRLARNYVYWWEMVWYGLINQMTEAEYEIIYGGYKGAFSPQRKEARPDEFWSSMGDEFQTLGET